MSLETQDGQIRLVIGLDGILSRSKRNEMAAEQVIVSALRPGKDISIPGSDHRAAQPVQEFEGKICRFADSILGKQADPPVHHRARIQITADPVGAGHDTQKICLVMDQHRFVCEESRAEAAVIEVIPVGDRIV